MQATASLCSLFRRPSLLLDTLHLSKKPLIRNSTLRSPNGKLDPTILTKKMVNIMLTRARVLNMKIVREHVRNSKLVRNSEY